MRSDMKKQSSASRRVIDPSDPLHDLIEGELAGLSGAQAVDKLIKMFPPKEPPPVNSADQSASLDLQNLPEDPALGAERARDLYLAQSTTESKKDSAS